MTVGELKKALENVSDDVEVLLAGTEREPAKDDCRVTRYYWADWAKGPVDGANTFHIRGYGWRELKAQDEEEQG